MEASADKRLVIFGCGYLGSAVAREALQRGLRVAALTRNVAHALRLREQGIDAIAADLEDTAWHERIAGAPELVLNCVSSGGGGPEGYRRSYLAGMQSIVAWAKKRGEVGTLVYTSSTSVYPQSGGATVDETASTTDAHERGRILLETEGVLSGAAGTCRRWFVLRLAGIYGPGRHHLLDQVRAGEVSGIGTHPLNLVYRDDAAAAIWAAFAAPASLANETFNVADDGPAQKTEVVAWMAAALGVPVPSFSGKAAGERRQITPARIISNAKIKSRLGWRPMFPTFREGYEKILSP